MSPIQNTVFVLGAGFSVEQGYPLARDMRQHVISYLKSGQNLRRGYLKPWSGGLPKGQFYAGLEMVEGDGELPFEELLIKLTQRLKQRDAGPCHQTDELLRIGARRVLWDIHNSIDQVDPAYKNFAAWLRTDWHRHGVIAFKLGSSIGAGAVSGECAVALLPNRPRPVAGDQATWIDQLEQISPGRSL